MLDVFKEFNAKVEREIGRKLKNARVDNGGEYMEPFEINFMVSGLRELLLNIPT